MTLEDRFRLRGKVAAIVGGAGHLGSTLARAMREAGMTVAVLDPVRPKGADRAGVARLTCDVLSKRSLTRCRDTLLKRYGRVDVLLNAAGTNAPTPFFKISAGSSSESSV